MKIGKSHSTGDSLGLSADITAANYCDRARGFVAAAGGVGFVIRGIEGAKGSRLSNMRATEPQWLAWLAYFEAKKIPSKAARFIGQTTVPCEWPEDFDVEAPMSDRHAAIHVELTRDYRRRIAGLFNPLLRQMAEWDSPARPPTPQVRTSEWLKEYGSQPLRVSDVFKAHINQPREEPEPDNGVPF
jgi:hypothetical protein